MEPRGDFCLPKPTQNRARNWKNCAKIAIESELRFCIDFWSLWVSQMEAPNPPNHGLDVVIPTSAAMSAF